MDFLNQENGALMNHTQYKVVHAATMANNAGTTPEHTVLCILFSVLCCVMCVVGRNERRRGLQHSIEYIGIIVPMLLAHTVLQSFLFEITKLILTLVYYKWISKIKMEKVFASFNTANTFTHQRLQCITNVRGLTYLLTYFCILAVDFAVFPRVLGKTERYGFSLMDTGVGMFALCSGMIHKSYPKMRFIAVMKDNWKLLFLLGLGLTRLFALKAVEYHEHITEYGVHWNFFYTLFVTKSASIMLLHLAGTEWTLPLSVTVLVSHQALLSMGLEKWVFSDAPRDNLISANREGIVSSLGYISLYLFGAFLKQVLNNRTVLKSSVLAKLFLIWIVSYVLIFRMSYLTPVSRVLANAGYCMFIVCVSTMIIMIFYFLEVVLYEHATYSVPYILDGFNNNGLFIFLIANAFTGTVNLSIMPLLVPPAPSVMVLNCYMCMLFYISIVLEQRGLRM